jgi:hypothetical protein
MAKARPDKRPDPSKLSALRVPPLEMERVTRTPLRRTSQVCEVSEQRRASVNWPGSGLEMLSALTARIGENAN